MGRLQLGGPIPASPPGTVAVRARSDVNTVLFIHVLVWCRCGCVCVDCICYSLDWL